MEVEEQPRRRTLHFDLGDKLQRASIPQLGSGMAGKMNNVAMKCSKPF